MSLQKEVLKIFPVTLRNILQSTPIDYDKLQEIRLRVNAPLILIHDNKEYTLTPAGSLQKSTHAAVTVTRDNLRDTLDLISNYSMYAYEDEIRQGFITIQGGHRIGIAGKVIIEDSQIKGIKYISFINIRLSHQIKGCGSKVLPYILNENGIYHTLIISPPRCGKTTILRDIVRQLSNQETVQGMSVGLVDERSEIAACHMGVPQNDVGQRTDVLDCCPKADGMLMLIRSMSPRIIAVDEIGSSEDLEAIEYVINCGCQLIATVHGTSVDDLRSRPILRRLVDEKIFERYIVLNNSGSVGNVEAVFDAFGNNLLLH